MSLASYWQRGETLDFTNKTGQTIENGTIVVANTIVGVAGDVILPNSTGPLEVTGVFSMPKTTETEVIGLAPVQQYVAKNKTTDGTSLIWVVQQWLNKEYAKYIKICDTCGKELLKEDGAFGSKTKAALTIALQVWLNGFECVNLKVDGEFGDKTKAACKVVSTTVNAYTRGAQIVQGILYCNKYNPQMFNEVFNKDCETALKRYQKDRGLAPDGAAGKLFFENALK